MTKMTIKRKTIIKEIQEKRYFYSYFLFGKNGYQIKETLDALKKAVLALGFESFDLENFDAGENNFDIQTLKRAVLTPPMASSKRLIILDKIEKIQEFGRKILLSLLESPVETSILVMVMSQSPPRPKKKKSSFFDKLMRLARSERFDNLKPSSIKKWLKDYFEKRGYLIDEDAIETILEFIGNNQTSLAEEVEKIITYTGEKRHLEREDVLNILSSNMVKTVFDLTDAIGRKELKNALSILNYLLQWGEPPMKILAMLRRFLLELKGTMYYKRKNFLYPEIAKKMRIRDYVVNKYKYFLSNFTYDGLKARLNLLCDAELRMKTGKNDVIVLTDIVYNLIKWRE